MYSRILLTSASKPRISTIRARIFHNSMTLALGNQHGLDRLRSLPPGLPREKASRVLWLQAASPPLRKLLTVNVEHPVGKLGQLLQVVIQRRRVEQDGHEPEECEGATHIQHRDVSVQSTEDAGVVAADEEDLVVLQVRVAVDGAGHYLHRCDHDFGGFGKQGDRQEELDFHDRKIGHSGDMRARFTSSAASNATEPGESATKHQLY